MSSFLRSRGVESAPSSLAVTRDDSGPIHRHRLSSRVRLELRSWTFSRVNVFSPKSMQQKPEIGYVPASPTTNCLLHQQLAGLCWRVAPLSRPFFLSIRFSIRLLHSSILFITHSSVSSLSSLLPEEHDTQCYTSRNSLYVAVFVTRHETRHT